MFAGRWARTEEGAYELGDRVTGRGGVATLGVCP
jgi:hypothetical protein